MFCSCWERTLVLSCGIKYLSRFLTRSYSFPETLLRSVITLLNPVCVCVFCFYFFNTLQLSRITSPDPGWEIVVLSIRPIHSGLLSNRAEAAPYSVTLWLYWISLLAVWVFWHWRKEASDREKDSECWKGCWVLCSQPDVTCVALQTNQRKQKSVFVFLMTHTSFFFNV